MAKNTYGTGCFMLMNTGDAAASLAATACSTTVGWQLGDGSRDYALEGSVFIAGAACSGCATGSGIIETSAEIEALARERARQRRRRISCPAFAGLGAPHWDPHARGAISGSRAAPPRAHIARAALEAHRVPDRRLAATRCSATRGVALPELRVDGGAARNDLLMQFQADLLGVPVVRPQVTRRRRSAPPISPGSRSGCGRVPPKSRHCGAPNGASNPHERGGRASRMPLWSRAVDRARRWDEPGA